MNKLFINILALLLTMATNAVAQDATSTYSANSVLANGKWAKISVSETGICKLTQDVIQKAGFSDLSKVRVYGYGGGLIPQKLTQSWLADHDDLKEIATYSDGNAKYFYGEGTVTWESATAETRTRNAYANYGCYFITQGDATPLACTEQQLLETLTAGNNAYHTLIEEEKYSYSSMGRDLVSSTEIKAGTSSSFTITIPSGNTSATIAVRVAAGAKGSCQITIGESSYNSTFSFGDYDKQKFVLKTRTDSNILKYADADGNIQYPVTIKNSGSNPLRLDYISATFATPRKVTSLEQASIVAAKYVENVNNQNHHADSSVDLVIIIPTSGNTLSAAEELAKFHAEHDGMTYRIIKANELYNEFSSGTPDVSAYKRYLKMFYDKATKDLTNVMGTDIADTIPSGMPKNVLLFGSSVWDNRMITTKNLSADDYLLGYQTENSVGTLTSLLSDDFIAVMQDERNIHVDDNESKDRDLRFGIGIGRISATNSSDAHNVVEKIKHYCTTTPETAWQNDIMLIGDDGDSNSHMTNANSVADAIIKNHPGYNVRKVMLDAYALESFSTGDRYPAATTVVTKQQADGALIMDYVGHSSWVTLSHEKLLELSDFKKFKGENYPLWITAGCETMPFDLNLENLGEAALFNNNGGAIAFYGTTRTVVESRNAQINTTFTNRVLSYDKAGKPLTLGEAQRKAKNDLVRGGVAAYDYTVNKHAYVLLGDPAMSLALPQYKAVIDSINGNSGSDIVKVKGLGYMNVAGHIEDMSGKRIDTFNGKVRVTVKDSKVNILCRNNNDEDNTFNYNDRPTTLYSGSSIVNNGTFQFTFRMPQEINNDGGNGLITLYAYEESSNIKANGETDRFAIEGWEEYNNDNLGPSIFCYLNSSNFSNGGTVGKTPFFVAEIQDKDGINATGTSLGHNMELVIDGMASLTYDLTSNFVYDSGSSTAGQTYYVIPELTTGEHSLTFRAWDLLNNSSTVSLNFNVAKGVQPELTDIRVSPNPVKGTTTFYVTHDMQGSEATVRVEIIDPCGKMVEAMEWYDTFSSTRQQTSYRWTPSGIAPGIYLYRVRLSHDGSDYVSKTKKLIIAQ